MRQQDNWLVYNSVFCKCVLSYWLVLSHLPIKLFPAKVSERAALQDLHQTIVLHDNMVLHVSLRSGTCLELNLLLL